MPPAKLTRDMRDALAVFGYLLLSAQQTAKAHAVFRGMQALFPDDAHVVKSLALTSLAAGKAQEALTLAESARGSANADDALVLDIVRGKALFALGRTDEAKTLFEQVMSRRSKGAPPARTAGNPTT